MSFSRFGSSPRYMHPLRKDGLFFLQKRLLLWLCLALQLYAPLRAAELDYYLPDSGSYQQEIPAPSSVLGFKPGTWHARPEQIVSYFRALAAASPRMTLIETGHSWEQRPLLLAVITSPANHAQLESLRLAHLAGDSAPLVTWLGHSVHGNEASGANAAMLTAWHLAAAVDEATLAMLDEQIILLDPVLNPDGLARFAHWANMYRGQVKNLDPAHEEHHEAWPNGRTNHYWFDLNRDWLPAQHPESVARLVQFHLWRPHVMTDHHEMGSERTFFFQPGVKSRHHPLIPEGNYPLTRAIAEFHAEALDGHGNLYYSREGFDDFYFGKGSTYPDIQGSIGILFEQASVRGHARSTGYGELTFPLAIRNQITTALSTLTAVQQNGRALRALRASHHRDAAERARENRNRALLLHTADSFRRREMQRILSLHQIEAYPLARQLTLGSAEFPAGETLILPYQQPQYTLIQAMFEVRTRFSDKVFYDVSAWNLALAFDMQFRELSRSRFSDELLGEPREEVQRAIDPSGVAIAFDWSQFQTVRLLSRLQQAGVLTLGLTKPGRYATPDGPAELSAGSIVVPLKQTLPREKLLAILGQQLRKTGALPVNLSRGLAFSGPDLGSPQVRVLKPVRPLLITGEGVRSYDAGEVWHFLDQRLGQQLTLMNGKRLAAEKDLGTYTHLLLADGRYSFSETVKKRISAWVEEGGILIASSRGAKWLLQQDWFTGKVKTFVRPKNAQAAYADRETLRAEHRVGGAIVKLDIDLSHPLAFGLDDASLPVFKRTELAFTQPDQAFARVASFAENPKVAGYMSDAVADHLQGAAAILIQRRGRGRLIAFSDNMLFRAFWLGSARVYANAVYYGGVTDAPLKMRPPRQPPPALDDGGW